MPQRPPQGRGSGGRVTPSPKRAPSPTPSAKRAKGDPKGSGASAKGASAKGASARGPSTGGSGKAGRSKGAAPEVPAPRAGRGAAGKGRVLQADERKQPRARGRAARIRDRVADEDGLDAAEIAEVVEPAVTPRTGKARGGRARPTEVDEVVAVDEVVEAPGRSPLSGWRALLGPARDGAVAAKDRVRPWWGIGDVAIWFIVGQVLVGLVIFNIPERLGYSLTWPTGDGARAGEAVRQWSLGQPVALTQTAADMPLWLAQLVSTVPLWIAFLAGPIYATWRKGLGLVRDFKLAVEWKDVPIGLGIGLFAQLVMVTLVYRIIFIFIPEQDVSAGARSLTDRATSPAMVVLLLLMVGVLTPIIEELFFRGLTHQAFKKRMGPIWGSLCTAAFFAITHTNPLYFIPLFLFALALSWLVERYQRLGPAIFAHMGFNLVTAVSLVWNLGW